MAQEHWVVGKTKHKLKFRIGINRSAKAELPVGLIQKRSTTPPHWQCPHLLSAFRFVHRIEDVHGSERKPPKDFFIAKRGVLQYSEDPFYAVNGFSQPPGL